MSNSDAHSSSSARYQDAPPYREHYLRLSLNTLGGTSFCCLVSLYLSLDRSALFSSNVAGTDAPEAAFHSFQSSRISRPIRFVQFVQTRPIVILRPKWLNRAVLVADHLCLKEAELTSSEQKKCAGEDLSCTRLDKKKRLSGRKDKPIPFLIEYFVGF